MSGILSPDCREGKHRACHGDAWNFHDDAPIDCQCGCHASVALVKPAEDAFGITHRPTREQALGLMAAQFTVLGEAIATTRRLEGVIEQKAIEEK